MSGAAPQVLLAAGDRPALAAQLLELWRQGGTAAIAVPQEQQDLRRVLPAAADPAWGPAVVLGSGGSLGARHWCLQPLAHLQAAAAATATWLRQQGLEPAATELFNPLPLQHVSGLMPLVRAEAWGVPLRWLAPELMRNRCGWPRRRPRRPLARRCSRWCPPSCSGCWSSPRGWPGCGALP